MLGVCAAILLRHRNQKMNLLQRIITLIFHSGHASKQVYKRLQKLQLTMSRDSTLSFLDEIGLDYDSPVIEWRGCIENEMKTSQSTLDEDAHVVHSPVHEVCNDSEASQQSHDVLSESDESQGTNGSDSETDASSPDKSSCSSSSSRDVLSTTSSESSSINLDDILGPLPPSYPLTFPSFKLVGDNIDKEVKPRDMRSDHQTKSLHYFHSYAVLDRIDLSGVSDIVTIPEVSEVNLTDLLPTSSDDEALVSNYAVFMFRVLKRHMPFFKFRGVVERHIQHEHSYEMSQKSTVVPTGIDLKSEQKYEEMIPLCQRLQEQYVPRLETIENVSILNEEDQQLLIPMYHFHPILFGGDQLTVARIRGCRRIMSNSQTDLQRLKGLIPVVEDWHAKQSFLGVAWIRLYSASSGIDGGTLFQLRNLINRRNVRKLPQNDLSACEDFFNAVTDAHILTAAMTFFNMSSLDDRPSNTYFPEGFNDLTSLEKRKVLMLAIKKLTKKFVNVSLMNKKDEEQQMDGVYEYASETLSLGLLYAEFNDAIKEGDGERIIRCWRYFLLIFKSARRKNYAIEAFTLLAQEQYLLSPRQALQLKWSRTINTHGFPGKNIPCDLHMEHLNRECKTALSGLGSNITDKSIQRIGQSIGKTVEMLENFDEINLVTKQSGFHTSRSSKKDVEKLVGQLFEVSKVFTNQPATDRCHQNFKTFKSNMVQSLKHDSLKQWMIEQFNKLLYIY